MRLNKTKSMLELLYEGSDYGNKSVKEKLTLMRRELLSLLQTVKKSALPTKTNVQDADALHGRLLMHDLSDGDSSQYDLIMAQDEDDDKAKKKEFLERLAFDLIEVDKKLLELEEEK